jgi:hypothetical protein
MPSKHTIRQTCHTKQRKPTEMRRTNTNEPNKLQHSFVLLRTSQTKLQHSFVLVRSNETKLQQSFVSIRQFPHARKIRPLKNQCFHACGRSRKYDLQNCNLRVSTHLLRSSTVLVRSRTFLPRCLTNPVRYRTFSLRCLTNLVRCRTLSPRERTF